MRPQEIYTIKIQMHTCWRTEDGKWPIRSKKLSMSEASIYVELKIDPDAQVGVPKTMTTKFFDRSERV
jgi:hypothetical protein